MKLLPAKEENKEGKEGPSASPDLTHSATESCGCITYDQIDALLSPDDVKSEQIEDILAKLTEMSVSVIESGSDTDIEATAERTTSTEPKEEFEAENQLAVVRQRAVYFQIFPSRGVPQEVKNVSERAI